jgi:ABC-2 type transport system ATP-binding protein
MAGLLARLHVEHFVLDLAHPVATAPMIEGCQIELMSDKSLNVAIPKEHGLNKLFSQLTAQNIEVISLKNKTNRLEQLFMDLIDSNPKYSKPSGDNE